MDSLPARFFRLALANALSNIFVPLAGLMSVMFLGHLTQIHHLAGVALAGILFNFLTHSLGFVRMSTIGVTAQAVGQNEPEEILLVLVRNSAIAIVLSGIILVLQVPIRELGFSILTASLEVKTAGLTYFNITIWTIPAVLINSVLMGWFLGREMSGKVLVLAAIATLTNICFDYFLIVRFGWAEVGAGLSQIMSQYLVLLLGIGFVLQQIDRSVLKTILPKVPDPVALGSILRFKQDLFISTLINVCVVFLFNGLGATLGTLLFTSNSLIVQIGQFTMTLIGGLTTATATLAGILKGGQTSAQLIQLIKLTIVSSLAIGLTLASTYTLFPQTIFGLLTDHLEVIQPIKTYIPWMLLILGFGSISHSLEGYFLGLAEGKFIRNLSFFSTLFAFSPLALLFAFYTHNNHTLWLAFGLYKLARVAILSSQIPRTLAEANPESKSKSNPKSNPESNQAPA